jgi:integrase
MATLRQKGERRWEIRYYTDGPDGKKRQQSLMVHGTERDARREKTRIERELDVGTFVKPARQTVGEYLESWVRDTAPLTVSTKTAHTYTGLVTNHLIAGLGKHPLEKLTPAQVRAFYTQRLQSGRLDGKGGLSPQTVLHLHTILATALHQAVKDGLLARSPLDAVTAPHVPQQETPALDEDGSVRLLLLAQGTRLYLPILIAVTTGLRRAEVLALRWSDVDLNLARLRVQQTLEEIPRQISFKEPKSKRSRRVVALPPLLIEALRQAQQAQAERKELFGISYEEHGLVVAQPDGKPWKPNNLTCAFAWFRDKHGLGRLSFHDLRHSHVSELIRMGVDLKTISARIGHSSSAFTLNTYGHLLDGQQEAAAQKIEAAFGSRLAPGPGTDEGRRPVQKLDKGQNKGQAQLPVMKKAPLINEQGRSQG